MGQLINGVTPLAEARSILAAEYDLAFSPAIDRATADIFARVRNRIPAVEWPLLAPLVFQINRLKRERHALVLAHRYQSPEIFHGVADVTGDSLGLALAAAAAPEPVLVACGVRFLAETAKVLNPQKSVLLPDGRAGCSIADSITVRDVLAIKRQYPGAPVVAYMTSPAEVKAVADVCCTSANLLAVLAALPGDSVILVPDQFLARNAARHTEKRLIAWAGACEVHESFTATDIAELRNAYPGARILAHPECAPDVVAAADYAGSTDELIGWVRSEHPARVVMVTECSMSDNLASAAPEVEFLRGCSICPHMKRVSLENILWSLHTLTETIELPPETIARAAAAIDRMRVIERAAAGTN
jgi:quinolinate synthase